MEISGKGNELAAKLINKSGSSFMVQKGTVLQSGHTVDEISQTYLRADKNGTKDYYTLPPAAYLTVNRSDLPPPEPELPRCRKGAETATMIWNPCQA